VGESLHEIGRAYGRTPSSIHLLLSHHGGIVPTVRRRSSQALTLTEREDISRGIASGSSMREIAMSLSRAASTVSREVARHGGRFMYRASEVDSVAWESARRPKLCLLAIHERLREIVVSKLVLDWSPEQVSGWLKIQYPKDKNLRVSHETIYRSLFLQARGVLKKELIGYLRSKRRIRPRSTRVRVDIRRAKSSRPSPSGTSGDRGPSDPRSLGGRSHQRHKEQSHRDPGGTAVTLHSAHQGASKETTVVVAALSRHIRKLPASLRRSLTWDRGHEMAQHKPSVWATDVKVYFCDPHSPWQRGTNENTNRLLRQYLPNRTDLSLHTQSDLDKIALRLNQRPRKTLGFETPATKLRASVASTH
jgi:IS30 family transposase